ncbi:predicted protein [Scheffersomyces stipitis CBS 6054]|uniref:Pre-rRNA processing protein n=1 Tax=Scheffersomyces stipitis (strain ATCC 58785 / CBS 6054 / NBRC 10063 / NRRL Y-11545) TaxID=322104 RepID=A3LX70_PICST|nr:predicted protein [Scheffersomyces stipitis CBS 6054]ABN67412.1 predicted protein [Scheffersomyces stipitis CBS 6054]KAG2732001.1 hypothetical protein G9P44_004418 [Scheffersomyces stipitis]
MNAIDPTEYVEVPEGVESLKFSIEKQQAKFELGVCMAIYKWEELNTAVENSWGGPKSGEKRDWLSGVVIDLFDEKAVDIQLIEETLLYAMVDEFDTEIDNDSALEVAALVMKFYKDVSLEKYAQIDELYEKWSAKQAIKTNAHKVHVEEDPNNPDVSDSDEDEEDEEEDATQMDVDAMEVDEEPQGPIVDDDGFELVQKKGRKGRR